MGRIATILLFICIIKLGYSQKKYSTFIDHNNDFKLVNNEFFFGRDTMITEYYHNGNIKAIGKYAINEFGKISSLKIGRWIEFYPNKTISSKGDYQISSVLDCGVAGLERIFYNYKIGYWTYNFENSSVAARGKYEIITSKIKTRCKGDDKMIFMDTTSNWEFFDSERQQNASDKSKYLTVTQKFDDGFIIDYIYDKGHKEVITKFRHE